jgi:hypothetical protein
MSFLINPYIYADASVCISPLISTSDLQVYYKFDGNSSDSSGSGNTGSATDITYSSGKFDDAAVFNGTSAFVRMPSKDYSASTSFTLTAWIKTTGTTEQHIITRDKVNMSPSSNNRRCWQFRIDASTGVLRAVRFQNNTTVLSNFASTASVNDGNWHHVAMVFDNAVGTKIYIDGSVDGSDALTTNNNNVSDSQPVVGAIQGGTGGVEISFFNGMIDEGVFYNRALTSSEISTLAVGTCPLADAPGFENDYSINFPTYSVTPADIEYLYINNQSNAIDTALRDTTPNFSVSAWVKLDAGSNNQPRNIFAKFDNFAGRDRCFTFSINSANKIQVYGQYNASNSSCYLETTATYSSANGWFHVLFVYDNTQTTAGTIAKLYVNGAEVTSFSIQTVNTTHKYFMNQTTESYRGYIGTIQFAGATPLLPSLGFGGFLDEITFWDKSLSSAEVTEIYNSGDAYDISLMPAYSSNCLAWWRMGDFVSDNWDGSKWNFVNVKGTANTNLQSVNLVEADRVTDVP